VIDVLLAATDAEAETSKTLFYVAGGALAAWAVAISVLGFVRPAFPGSGTAARAVIAVSVALAALVGYAAIATS
jgi:hypothetical protein